MPHETLAAYNRRVEAALRPGVTKAMKEAGANAARAASESLQSALDTAASVVGDETEDEAPLEGAKLNGTAEPEETEAEEEEATMEEVEELASAAEGHVSTTTVSAADDKVTVQVESTVEVHGDVETTHTNVKVQT